jgi:tRNA/tmRNA/rRNA uracil-C5-methylase (TrmA/RlmC/RlmD family)
VESPKPRKYRTTSKRRVMFLKDTFHLTFGSEIQSRRINEESELEPDEHSQIFDFLAETINRPPYKFLAKNLNFLIIRGNYNEFSVIFNVKLLNGDIVRKLKSISEGLEKLNKKIVSAFVYFDPSESDFYFESKVPKNTLQFKKLFGQPKITVSYEGHKYFFHPTSFSQVNESMVPKMLQIARENLLTGTYNRLIDLYCGYGLFSYYFGNDFPEIFGIDYEGDSIKSAIESLEHFKGKSKIKFYSFDINFTTLQKSLPKDLKNEILILDPPRQGTKPNVIQTLAERSPQNVLHIFCGIDEIKRETSQWIENGYSIKKIIPLDMFPGTGNIETMIFLEKHK